MFKIYIINYNWLKKYYNIIPIKYFRYFKIPTYTGRRFPKFNYLDLCIYDIM